MLRCVAVLLLLISVFPAVLPAEPEGPRVLAQEIAVRFEPAEHRISGAAELFLSGGGTLTLHLHDQLTLTAAPGALLRKGATDGYLRSWSLTVPPASGEQDTRVAVRYEGILYDAVDEDEALTFVIGDDTRGVIGEEGIFLVAGSGWYPLTGDVTTYRRVTIDVPDGIRAVTQGGLAERMVEGGRERTVWTSDVPVDGLAMQAGEYVVESRQVGETTIAAWLFPRHRQHAEFILDEVEEYLGFYEPILGPYPWPQFAVVENFFTTGYGMPSYTLLGDNVVDVMVRMAPRYGGHIPPGFVDHELVHCWWGNYVYPDYATGNWCEGLTTYCSNYLMKESRNPADAMAHRKKICTNFAIRVDGGNDYPVRDFRGKTEDFDNDIGYGKAAMVFHMLRRRIGDRAFFGTLKTVVREHGGTKTSWSDFAAAFGKAAGEDLGWYFEQWTGRKGAPDPRLGELRTTRQKDGRFLVTGEIRQAGDPWQVRIPVRVAYPGGVTDLVVEANGSTTAFTATTPRVPLSVELDPDFEVFRTVPIEEIQPCLNLTLEREDKVYLVPAAQPAYAPLAAMAKARKGGEIVLAGEDLPAGNCMLFGRPEENPAVAKILAGAGVTVEGNAVTVKGTRHEGEDLWLLLSVHHPDDPTKFVTVFFGMTEKALARARVIYHFGWDGHLVYSGRPLSRGDFTEVTPRTRRSLAPKIEVSEIRGTLDALTDPVLEGRRAGTPGDTATRQWLHDQLEEAGVIGVHEAPFSFEIRDFDDPDAWTVSRGELGEGGPEWKTTFPGAVLPAVFSPETRAGIRIDAVVLGSTAAVVLGSDATVPPRTLVVLPADLRTPDALLEAIGEAAAAGAAAVGIPMATLDDNRALASWAAYPGHLDPKEADPWRAAAGMQARAPRPDLGIPVVFVDHRVLPEAAATGVNVTLRVRFTKRKIESANLVGVIPDRNGHTSGAATAIGAHFDGLGRGFAGADDNASGVAALLAASRFLATRRDLLGTPVRVFLFGAEEWGLYGSAALVAEQAAEVRSFVNLDTIGARDVPEAFLIGRSHHEELARTAGDCLAALGFGIGRDIDRFAFAHGSDHWSFHQAGVPSIDLFSGQYRRMNSLSDALEMVDPAKIARIAAATALLMVDQAPVPPRAASTFPGEEAHLRNIRMLTFEGENAEAYFPPEENLLCFQAKRGGLKADQIFVMNLDGTGQRMVSNGKGATTCSYLFPGSKRILYATTMFAGDEPPAPPDYSQGYVWKLHPEFDIVAHDLDGSNQVRLTDSPGYDAEATLSRDGEWIVFTSCRDGDPEIYRMRKDGSDLERLTHADGYDGGPFYSFDGKQIIWRANRPKTPEEIAKYQVLRDEGLISPMSLQLWVMDADGGNQRQITDNGAANFGPFFHPDGKRVIFCSNLGSKGHRGMPNFDLWIIGTDGTGLSRVTHCPDFDGFPMFMSDGKTLVFCSNRDNGDTSDTNVFLADWID